MSKILHKYLTRSLLPTCSSFPQRWQWQPTVRVTWELGQQVTNCFHTGQLRWDLHSILEHSHCYTGQLRRALHHIWTYPLLLLLREILGNRSLTASSRLVSYDELCVIDLNFILDSYQRTLRHIFEHPNYCTVQFCTVLCYTSEHSHSYSGQLCEVLFEHTSAEPAVQSNVRTHLTGHQLLQLVRYWERICK